MPNVNVWLPTESEDEFHEKIITFYQILKKQEEQIQWRFFSFSI